MVKRKSKISPDDLAQKIDSYRAEVVGFKVDLTQEFNELKEKINLLPNKQEYFESQSKLMGELEKTRVVQSTTQDLYDTVTKRIEVIDDNLGINSLTLAY